MSQKIKITVTPEKYLNNDCPEITEEMIDWLFLTLWSTRYYFEVKKITIINIRVNQAYEGSRSLHFYIRFDDSEEYHKEWQIGSLMKHQIPTYYSSLSFSGKIQRWEWMINAVNNGVDLGQEGIDVIERYDKIREDYKRNEEIKKNIANEVHQYNMYLNSQRKYDLSIMTEPSKYYVDREMIKSIVDKIRTDDINCNIGSVQYDDYEEATNKIVEFMFNDLHLVCTSVYEGWLLTTELFLATAINNVIVDFRIKTSMTSYQYVESFYQSKHVIYTKLNK